MKEFTYVITDEIGIHARPAGLLVKEAKKFKSDITILANGKEANATKLMALMNLGVKNGMQITVRVQGEDEEIAKQQMQTFVHNHL